MQLENFLEKNVQSLILKAVDKISEDPKSKRLYLACAGPRLRQEKVINVHGLRWIATNYLFSEFSDYFALTEEEGKLVDKFFNEVNEETLINYFHKNFPDKFDAEPFILSQSYKLHPEVPFYDERSGSSNFFR